MGSNGVTTRDYQPRNRQVSCHTGLAAIMTKGMYIMLLHLLSQCLSGCFAACDYVIYLYSGIWRESNYFWRGYPFHGARQSLWGLPTENMVRQLPYRLSSHHNQRNVHHEGSPPFEHVGKLFMARDMSIQNQYQVNIESNYYVSEPE